MNNAKLCCILKFTGFTLAVNDDSGAEDTVVVVEVKPNLDTSEAVLAEIAKKIWRKMLSKAGLRGVPLRVLVSIIVVISHFACKFLTCVTLPSYFLS